jgi:hypothetical protein
MMGDDFGSRHSSLPSYEILATCQWHSSAAGSIGAVAGVIPVRLPSALGSTYQTRLAAAFRHETGSTLRPCSEYHGR